MLRSLRPWLLTLPLAAAGTLAGHALAYRAVGIAGDDLHGYLAHLPRLLVLLLVLGLVGASLVEQDARLAAWPFPAVAVAGFVVQEHLERLAHDGSLPVLVGQPVFLLGLALQLPVALLVWILARLLLRVVGRRGLASLVECLKPTRRARRPGAPPPVRPPSAHRPRGPPLAV